MWPSLGKNADIIQKVGIFPEYVIHSYVQNFVTYVIFAPMQLYCTVQG